MENTKDSKKTPISSDPVKKPHLPGNEWKAGETLDADTYGSTGTNTLATGAGTSGGFGSTGGSIESGSSDYDHTKSASGVHTYRSPSEMSSTDAEPAPSSRSRVGVGNDQATGAKAGAGDNGARFVSGSSDAPSASSSVGTPSVGASSLRGSENFSSSDSTHLGASRADMEGFKSTDDTSKSAGNIQSVIMRQINELGDLIERAGEKIEQAGFTKIGEAIYRLGDRLEHLQGSSKSHSIGTRRDVKADDSVEVDSSPSFRNSGTTNSETKPAGTDQSQAY